MLLAVTGEDLIAKEFKIHDKCDKDYTRVCSKPILKKSSTDQTSKDLDNFRNLENFVQEHIHGDQSVSIKLLTELYGFDKEDSRLRNKVKQKLEQEFNDRICFVSTSYLLREHFISRSRSG